MVELSDSSDDAPRYHLYWTWNSAAMSCHAALEEIGVAYQLHFIDPEKPWPEDYLKLNPTKKVPTLIDTDGPGEDGFTIYPSAAILLYLADCHPEAGLAPPPGSRQRGQCYQWLFFLAESLQAAYLNYYYPERHTADAEGTPQVAERAALWIVELWGRLNTQIGDAPYLLGNDFGICDLYMQTMAVWNRDDSNLAAVAQFQNVARTIERIENRPAVARMLAAHIRPPSPDPAEVFNPSS